MGMRKEWQDAKSLSETAFKKANPIGKDPHINPPKPYPLKFKEDLGPTLDSLEKTTNLGNLEKYTSQAKKVIGSYRTQVNGAKNALGPLAAKILLDALGNIEKEVNKKGA